MGKSNKLEGKLWRPYFTENLGYHQRINHGVGFEIICKRYNHSSPAITMAYLGIEDKEVHTV